MIYKTYAFTLIPKRWVIKYPPATIFALFFASRRANQWYYVELFGIVHGQKSKTAIHKPAVEISTYRCPNNVGGVEIAARQTAENWKPSYPSAAHWRRRSVYMPGLG